MKSEAGVCLITWASLSDAHLLTSDMIPEATISPAEPVFLGRSPSGTGATTYGTVAHRFGIQFIHVDGSSTLLPPRTFRLIEFTDLMCLKKKDRTTLSIHNVTRIVRADLVALAALLLQPQLLLEDM